MNPYLFETKFFGIRWYSVLILVGAFIGIHLFEKEGYKHKLDRYLCFNMAFWSVVFGIIGARAYYVLFNFSLYQEDILSIFKIWEGGLAIHGGMIAGLMVILYYTFRYKLNFFRITDYAAPSLFIAQAIGRWGNFFNGEAHGSATSLANLQNMHIPQFIINGMKIGGIYYEPTFLYESIFCLIGFIIIILIRNYKYLKIGTCTAFYLVYYGIVRFFIESMRTDSLMLGGFKAAQIVSLVMFFSGVIYLMVIFRKGKFENLYSSVDDTIIRY